MTPGFSKAVKLPFNYLGQSARIARLMIMLASPRVPEIPAVNKGRFARVGDRGLRMNAHGAVRLGLVDAAEILQRVCGVEYLSAREA